MKLFCKHEIRIGKVGAKVAPLWDPKEERFLYRWKDLYREICTKCGKLFNFVETVGGKDE